MELTSLELEEMLAANLPEGAFGLHVDSTEDQRHQEAAEATTRQGDNSTPVKEGLRQQILLRRQKAGQPELKFELPQTKTYKLTPEEKTKKERRKEQNRRAAKRCREKRKNQESGVLEKFKKTEETNQQLKNQVNKLQQLETWLKSWLLTHLAVCSFQRPPEPGQPVPQQQQKPDPLQSPASPLLQQHVQQQQQQLLQHPPHFGQLFQQQQHMPPMQDPLQLPSTPLPQSMQQQEQQLYQGYSSSTPASPVPNIHPQAMVTLACGVEVEQPSLGSQGFDAICSQLQSHMASQELDAALCGDIAMPQDNVGGGVPTFSQASNPSGQQPTTTTNLPQHLRLPAPTFSYPPATVQNYTTEAYLPSSSSAHLPASVQELQPAPQQAQPTVLPPVITNSVDSEEAILDLPGFPFAMRKKRKSTDSCVQAGKGKSNDDHHQSKMAKSATYPCMVSSPGGQVSLPTFHDNFFGDPAATAVSFTLGSSPASSSKTDKGTCTVTSSYQNAACPERASSPAPPSPFLTLPTSMHCSHRGDGFSTPTPSPSPRSPGCFRFASVVTPPPRSSHTPQPPSPLTPPPSATSIFPGEGGFAAIPPTQNALTGPRWEVMTPTNMRSGAEPGDQSITQDGLTEDLEAFLSSNICLVDPDDPDCLSSRNIHDLLQDGLMSSQED